MNINWTECNLKWSDSNDHYPYKTFDHSTVADDALKDLGFTEQMLQDENETIRADLNTETSRAMAAANNYWEFIDNNLDQFPAHEIKRAIDDKSEVYYNWLEVHPTYLAWAREEKTNKENYQYFTFCGLKLNKPGVLIQLESGKIELIGTINNEGGLCNCCAGISDNDVVVRYAQIANLDEVR